MHSPIKAILGLALLFSTLVPSFADEVVQRLRNEIHREYIPALVDQFGACAQEPCLSDDRGALKLKLADRQICLPYTSCGFYDCMEEQYQCDTEGVHYFTQLARPTCQSYVDNINRHHFSEQGREWIYEVMVCLQKGLIDECTIAGNCERQTRRQTCDHIVDFTLQFHPGCYLESGIGICNLSFLDQAMIWKTVGPYLTGREWIEAFRVVAQCLSFKEDV